MPQGEHVKKCVQFLGHLQGLHALPFEDYVSLFLQLLNVTSSLDLKGLLMSFGHALFLKRPNGTSQLQHVLLGPEAKG